MSCCETWFLKGKSCVVTVTVTQGKLTTVEEPVKDLSNHCCVSISRSEAGGRSAPGTGVGSRVSLSQAHIRRARVCVHTRMCMCGGGGSGLWQEAEFAARVLAERRGKRLANVFLPFLLPGAQQPGGERKDDYHVLGIGILGIIWQKHFMFS